LAHIQGALKVAYYTYSAFDATKYGPKDKLFRSTYKIFVPKLICIASGTI